MKSFLRASKANGSTKRRVENFARRGERPTRRQSIKAMQKFLNSGGLRDPD